MIDISLLSSESILSNAATASWILVCIRDNTFTGPYIIARAAINAKNSPTLISSLNTSLPPVYITIARANEPITSADGLASIDILLCFIRYLNTLRLSPLNLSISYSCELFDLIISILLNISDNLAVISELLSCER